MIIRNNIGDIDADQSALEFIKQIIIKRDSEIQSSVIQQNILSILKENKIIKKEPLLMNLCSNLKINPKDYENALEKINIVLNYMKKENLIKYKKGKFGGYYL